MFFFLLVSGYQQIDEHVHREIMNHRSLKHPHIVRFKEVPLAVLPLFLAIFSAHTYWVFSPARIFCSVLRVGARKMWVHWVLSPSRSGLNDDLLPGAPNIFPRAESRFLSLEGAVDSYPSRYRYGIRRRW